MSGWLSTSLQSSLPLHHQVHFWWACKKRKKSGLGAVSPTWYPFFIVFLAQASPAYAAHPLLRTQQTARLQTQPLSPKENKWRFISMQILHPSSYFLALLLSRPYSPLSLLSSRISQKTGATEQGTNACFSGLLQPLRSLEHHRQSVTKFSLMET